MTITIPTYIIIIDFIFLVSSIYLFCVDIKKHVQTSSKRRNVKNIIKWLRIFNFAIQFIIVTGIFTYVKIKTGSKLTRCILYLFTTLTFNFFTFQTLYYGLRVVLNSSKNDMVKKLLDVMFFVSFSSSIIVFIGFWGFIYPGGLFYYKQPFNFLHTVQELVLHGLNVIVPCIEFYYESKYMYCGPSFAYLLMMLFSSYCLTMAFIYNLQIVDWAAYLLLPWTCLGKVAIPLICYLSYYIIKKI